MNNRSVNWGVLGTARIALNAVIPAFQHCARSRVIAIASRSEDRARDVAGQFGIAKHFGSYAQLLQHGEVEAVYIPLPNHLHVEWSMRALEAGKHVLCEKPLALRAAELDPLMELERSTRLKVGEGFMIRAHPQWLKAKEIIAGGRIGRLQAIHGVFSFYNDQPENIRNIRAYGGGAMLDIGCYPINVSRFILDREPQRAFGFMRTSERYQVDILASAILDFQDVHSTFTVSTQMAPYQRMHFYGTQGTLEMRLPFIAPGDRTAPLQINPGDILLQDEQVIEVPGCHQYARELDEFSAAILDDGPVPVPLQDARKNLAVIDAVFESADSGRWVDVHRY